MINMITKIWRFVRGLIRPKSWKFWGVVVVILIILFLIFRGDNGSAIQTVEAKVGTLQQEVSATGKIKSAQDVDLAFDTSGKIAYIGVKVGDQITAGRTLMTLSSGEYTAQVMSAQAQVQSAQARLDQLLSGARDEEIRIAQIAVDSARAALDETLSKSAIDTARSALQQTINSSVTVTDVQYTYFTDNSVQSISLAAKKDIALFALYNQQNLGRVGSWYFLGLSTGLKGEFSVYESTPGYGDIQVFLGQLQRAMQSAMATLDIAYSGLNSMVSSDIDKTLISTTRGSLLMQLSAVSNQVQAITSARNAVKNAEAQLTLKNAPASSYDIDIARQQLTQAQANLLSAQTQAAKRVLWSPMSGIVSQINGSVGEMIGPSQIAVSVVGTSNFEIEANIPEADVAKLAVGKPSRITLDAYDKDIVWTASIVKIYPAATVIEGVPTYKTVLRFDKNDERIKPGMTANIDIITEHKENVLAIPQRAIIRRDNGKFVKVYVEKINDDSIAARFANITASSDAENGTIYEMPVETGIKGTEGKIEIVAGLQAGDRVVVN